MLTESLPSWAKTISRAVALALSVSMAVTKQKMRSNGCRLRAARLLRAGVDLCCLSGIRARAFALLLAAAALTTCGQAAEEQQNTPNSLRQLSLEQLGNMEVTTVAKGPEKIQRTPAAIYVLTQEDIRRSGATSIPELLRLVPGVEVARVSSDQWAVGIRGFESGFSKSVLVLIDGRSVYTPLFEGVYWDMQNLMLEDVERIEVIRGPGGTIWGANAVNGVINIWKIRRAQHQCSAAGRVIGSETPEDRWIGSVAPRTSRSAHQTPSRRNPDFFERGARPN